MPFSGFDIVIPVLVVLVLFLLFAGIKTVPQGYNYTVERFGRYTRTLAPGLNLIIPFFDRIGARMNMMEQVLDVPTQEVITRDNAIVAVDGVAFYQVLNAPQAAYQVAGLQNAILNLTMTNIRTVMGSMDLDELLSNRDAINERLLRVVDEAAHPWGIKVTRVEIKDINPPANMVESMARQMMAERNKRAQILEAEGLKQAQVLEAEGRKEAAFRDAEARERSAEAEARATQVVSEAIAKGNVQAINYFVAQKYTEALAKIASANNNKVVLMPMEASSLIGSLGGIGAIAKEVFGQRSSGAQCLAHAPAADAGTGLSRCDARRRKAMLEGIVTELGPWNWMVLGLVLLALEIVAARLLPAVDRHCGAVDRRPVTSAVGGRFLDMARPGGHLSRAFVDLPPMPARRSLGETSAETDQPLLNRRGEQMIGRTATLDGTDHRRTRHAFASATRCGVCQDPDLPAGARVRVKAATDTDLELVVEAA